jgi:hypothetical protein
MRQFIAMSISLLAAAGAYSQAPVATKRDKALEGIKACLRTNKASGRECKHLNQDVSTLVEVYRGGDKSVLPTLFQFPYLTDFYDEALLSDPDGFLMAMTHLSEKEQETVALGIAGEMGLSNVDRFKAIRALLASVPETSPTKAVAEVSLKVVETKNASHLVSYFPPGTFASLAGRLRVAWFSSAMYEMGETPLWPPSPENEGIFRFTYLGVFTGPKAVTLTLLPDGTGTVKMITVPQPPDQSKREQLAAVPQSRVLDFLNHLDHAHFWEMPTESDDRGFDGAEWILEGVHDGKYHIVVRWCPNYGVRSADDAAFAKAARFLFQLAGYSGSL